jgi:RHS repeat-associated protein
LKTVGSTVTAFLSDGDDEIAEYDGTSANVLRRFVPGPAINEPIAYENCSGATAPNCSGAAATGVVTEYYHTDHHGSVIAMSDATGNPSTTESNYTYDAYGNSPGMTTTGQPFRYVGMYFDAETGLYADRARVYSPALGRFLQNDPIGYKDNVDLYIYADDDPTNADQKAARGRLSNPHRGAGRVLDSGASESLVQLHGDSALHRAGHRARCGSGRHRHRSRRAQHPFDSGIAETVRHLAVCLLHRGRRCRDRYALRADWRARRRDRDRAGRFRDAYDRTHEAAGARGTGLRSGCVRPRPCRPPALRSMRSARACVTSRGP